MAEHTYSGFVSQGMQGTHKILEYDLVDEKVDSICKKVDTIKEEEKKIKLLKTMAESDALDLKGKQVLAQKLEILLDCYKAFLAKVEPYTNKSAIHIRSFSKRASNLDKLQEKIEEIKKREEAELKANQAEMDEINSGWNLAAGYLGFFIPGVGTATYVNRDKLKEEIRAAMASNRAEISSCNTDLAKIEKLRARGKN